MLIAFALSYLRLPPQIPLFYSLPNSTDQIVDMWMILVIPLMTLLTIILNMIVAKKLLDKNVFFEDIARAANVTVIVVTTYIFIKILLLVAW
jgi:hypothetical protein